jgi:hypothetical protein
VATGTQSHCQSVSLQTTTCRTRPTEEAANWGAVVLSGYRANPVGRHVGLTPSRDQSGSPHAGTSAARFCRGHLAGGSPATTRPDVLRAVPAGNPQRPLLMTATLERNVLTLDTEDEIAVAMSEPLPAADSDELARPGGCGRPGTRPSPSSRPSRGSASESGICCGTSPCSWWTSAQPHGHRRDGLAGRVTPRRGSG